ncbi:type I-E CRISPR-associated protein Cse2/CasB [Kitasatospora viridis]|uniref:CRISPR system Cascade subunit CasB n=1 Tax=Kitasatospora viridis TaxID=281105 RepID=A0A561T5Y0_9ACTN|nr:type I-E CRISPR-associated protein Cse2/CasB [Kitasatospora viridis]TWF82521.1 CRISPR system Cascade subunit CasB [Kitasatospora viridis]
MTSSTSPARSDRRQLRLVGAAVDKRLRELQSGYRNDRADVVADVARIRRGAGRSVADAPELWGVTGLELLYSAGQGARTAAEAENAFHSAVTLWALHQQGHREQGMHLPFGPELGHSIRQLMPNNDIDEPIRKRFVRLGTASSFDLLTQRLRELVLLFRRDAIPLDYAVLADQLVQWQQPGGRGSVHSSWGHSFHAYRPPATAAADDRSSDSVAPDLPSATDKDANS